MRLVNTCPALPSAAPPRARPIGAHRCQRRDELVELTLPRSRTTTGFAL